MINRVTRDRLLATTIMAGVSLLATPAFAQDPAVQAAPAPSAGPIESQMPASAVQPTADAAGGGGEIVVTGTRIAQPNLTSVAPVTILTNAEIKNTGTTRVEDLLNSLPQVFAGQSSTIANGATGIATVDLRNLGPERTLVLINGRRLLPGDPTSSVADLNAIPAGLVKRVDVLTGGASSTYGADAVAGVVNFVMDEDFTGVRLDGQYSLYQHDNRNNLLPGLLSARTGQGFSGYGYPTGNTLDGSTVDATLTIGSGFDDNRGHVTAYFGYRHTNAVTQDRRDYSACTLQNTGGGAANQCGGSLTSAPGNAILYDGGTSTVAGLGYATPGTIGVDPLRRYNFAPTNYYQRPDERYTAGFFAHYDVSDAFKPYMEFMFMDDRTLAQIAPSGDFGNTLSVNCDNPLLSAQQSSVICDAENLVVGNVGTFPLTPVSYPTVFGAGAAVPGPIFFNNPAFNGGANGVANPTYNKGFFQLLRRNVEGGPRIDDREHTEYRGVLGTKGTLSPAFSYDAYFQYGRTLLSETYSNEFSTRKLTNALDVISVNGTPTCRSVVTGTDPNCVPYDVFSPGGVTPAAISYVSASGFQRGINTEQVANASITGRLGQYGIQSPFANDGVSFNIGGEYRRETLELNTDEEFSTGDLTGQGSPTKPISGSFNVYEGFGEVQIPLVNDRFIYSASFNGGYRYSSYALSNGRKFTTQTFKIGGEFAPVRDIRFRGGFNRAVRAPNLQELFAPNIVALDGVTDPCAGFTITADDTGCLAQGLAVGQKVIPNPSAQYNGLVGGTSSLTPEKANTITLGAVIQPSFIRRFSLTVDYYNIKVKNAIQSFGADAIVNNCTQTASPLSCSLVHRNAAGSLWLTADGYVQDLNTNIGSVKTDGIDFDASYSYPVGDAGTLSANFVGTLVKKFRTDNGLTQAYDCVGLYGPTCGVPTPKWRHQARLTFSSKQGVSLSGRWRYFGPVDVDLSESDNATLGGTFYTPSHIKSQSYFDLVLSYTANEHYSLRAGVNNVTDKEPPLVTSGDSGGTGSVCAAVTCNGNTYPGIYDALGRYLYVGATLEF